MQRPEKSTPDVATPVDVGRRRSRKTVRVATVVAGGVLVAGLGAFLGIALASADLANTGLWLRDFAKSPGATATAALLAASLAFWGISRQVTVSRQTLSHQRDAATQLLEHQRKTEDSKAWWSTFEWSADRGIPSDPSDTALPLSVSIRTFEQLQESAQTDVQKAACGGVMDVLAQLVSPSEQVDGLPSRSVRTEPGDPNYEGARAALSSYVVASRGTAAASPGSEARLYDLEATSAVAGLNIENAIVRALPRLRGLALDGSATTVVPDVSVEINQRTVLLEFKAYYSASGAKRAIFETVGRFRARGISLPIIVVTPQSIEIASQWSRQNKCLAIQWRDSRDNDALRVAIQEAMSRFDDD
jgi:hypothetical protein